MQQVKIGKVKKRMLFKLASDKADKTKSALEENYQKSNIKLLKEKYISQKSILLFSTMIILFGFAIFDFSNRVYAFVTVDENVSQNLESEINSVGKILGNEDTIKVSTQKLNSESTNIDKRIYVLDQYFKFHNSPLYGHAKDFVANCDKYGAPKDCITIPAIAKHETDLCKYIYSAEMRNCLGWGGAGPNRMRFNSFEEHIDVATNVLVNQYGIEYMIDPRKMERVFCGPQDECIGWGTRVLKIMDTIDEFSVSLGMGKLTDLR